MSLTSHDIQKILSTALGDDVVCISAITLRGAQVGCMVTVAAGEKERGLALKAQVEKALAALPEIEKITVVVTAHGDAPAHPDKTKAQWNITPIEGVKKIIAVASGKGGVGKSTTTVNLAHALVAGGVHVGILDADIYGPSIPHMLGLPNEQPKVVDNKMQPALAHGIKVMSMGLITGEEAAILRGPMISKSLQQMLRFTAWGTLDMLLVDMPPGTGDIHLSMAQQVPMSGAIIVTTPQEVALLDARKCAKMFLKVNVPLLGVVENMTGEIFGAGGGQKLADEFSVPLLGSIPLVASISRADDAGQIYYQQLAAALEECDEAA